MSNDRNQRTPATILIAEDSATQAQELSFLLEEHGFAVKAAQNGRIALESARREVPDLIISDIVMPEMDGYTFCRSVKADAKLSQVPFILVTSLSSPHDVFKGLDVGADNFIVKPYDASLLLSRINYLLTNRDLRKAGKLQVGIEIELSGQRHFITAERQQILDLLISTYEQAVRLYDALDARQRELTRSYETLNALYGIAEGLNHCQTEVEVATSAVERGLTLPGVKAGWFYTFRDGAFRLVASRGAHKDLFEPSDEPCEECHCQRMVRRGELRASANIVECERLTGAASGLRYHASVPLMVADQVNGILNLVGGDQRMFSEDELRTLSSIGNQIGVALERAQLHESLERKVRKRTAELSSILDSTPVPTVTIDREGQVTTWNRAAESVFGYPTEDVLGKADPLAGSDADPEETRAALQSGRTVRGIEVQRRHKNGHAIDVRISVAPLLGRDGEVRGQVRMLEDQRERKRVEDQLRQAQKMEAIGNLTGGIAHDFNNLLTIIIGNVDMLARVVEENASARDMVEEALSACLRGADLTRQLLAFGRRQTLKPEIVDVNRLTRSMVKLLNRTLGENVRIDLIEGEALWPVVIDAAQLDAAIVNLAVNARDAMPGGGRLTIETTNVQVDESFAASHPGLNPGDYVVTSVTDTGTGIPPDIVARIFEPFFTTKEVNKGTGLGLAMVYGFVKQSGGHITVYSEVGAGTTFRLYLPRAVDGARAGEAPTALPPRQAARGGESVLVVEDNDGVRQMVVRQLKELGYRVEAVAEAGAAISAIERGAGIDLVFSDVVMPGEMNGIKLAAEIERRWPRIKVLLTSGFPEAALSRTNGENRAKILSKPYRTDQLSRAISELLQS
ncbi:MAG TPA: response regulator [Dongiaceae bacterium]|nr:response regulator [Dongiaceae bacterium]